MEQVRHRAYLSQATVNDVRAFRRDRTGRSTGLGQVVEVHFYSHQILSHTIVQISGDAAPFVVLQGQKAAGELASSEFGPLAAGDVSVELKPAGCLSGAIAQSGPAASHYNLIAVALGVAKFPLPIIPAKDVFQGNGKFCVQHLVSGVSDGVTGAPSVQTLG